MVPEEDAILGEVPVVARLGIGSESLKLFLTGHRLVVAHLRKTGLGALAAMPLLGKLAMGLVRSGESAGKSKVHQNPEAILAQNKDNFPLNYNDIVRVELDELVRSTKITVLTKSDKLEFFATMDFESLAKLFAMVLGERVLARPFGSAEGR